MCRLSKYRPSFLFCLLLILSCKVWSQKPLNINVQKSCLYVGDKLPAKLYQLSESDSASAIIDDITGVLDTSIDFLVIPSNVVSVVAISDSTRRYLCYSPGFVARNMQNNKEMLFAAFAHEIAHHYLGHSFSDTFYIKVEEREADVLTGYILANLGYNDSLKIKKASPPEALFPYRTSRTRECDRNERESYLLDWIQGMNQAKAVLVLEDNAQFAGGFEKTGQFAGLNIFPMPPPTFTGDAQLRQYFEQCHTLGQANDKLSRVLRQTGYLWKYMYVNNGFVAVTMMEQITSDRRSWPIDSVRWDADRLARNTDLFSLNYLKAMLLPNPGYFRVFAFVFSPESGGGLYSEISKEGARNWFKHYYGGDNLPSFIRDLSFTESTQVTALIYAFRMEEANGRTSLIPYNRQEGMKHLHQSKIQYYLER